MKLLVQIAFGALGLVVLAGAAMWVFGLGPFNTRPSAAAKLQPKVAASVAKTQTAATAAVTKVEAKTKTANAATEKRTEVHVAKIRAAAPPRAAAVDVSDREFFLGVCSAKLYARDPDCDGHRGEPEGSRPAARSGAVRGGQAPAS